MNQPVLLHIVERLESLVGKLPATIQRPVLAELTPLKELFLQQRSPRFVFVGSINRPASELANEFFGAVEPAEFTSIFRWQELSVGSHGTLCILDARGMGGSSAAQVREELKQQPADAIFFLDEPGSARRGRKTELQNLIDCLNWSDPAETKVIGIAFSPGTVRTRSFRGHEKEPADGELATLLGESLPHKNQLLKVFKFSAEASSFQKEKLMSFLAHHLPNEARIEMIRISRDRDAQREVAQVLVKSTSAICAAIGAQPIPLADLPILTTLQLVMVSGIMYLSGRERSLRAATEFVGAIGANVGVGMLFREGARALLKLLPGWGNVICGMVAGAGTYAIGRAATAFFLEGVSLKEARRTYLTSRKKRDRAPGPPLSEPKRKRSREK
jgi:uncharacterized protein (DUF697 family)